MPFAPSSFLSLVERTTKPRECLEDDFSEVPHNQYEIKGIALLQSMAEIITQLQDKDICVLRFALAKAGLRRQLFSGCLIRDIESENNSGIENHQQ